MIAPAWFAAQRALAAHSKLDDAMFWVGALFAFTPIVAILGVLGVVWWNRRHKGAVLPGVDEPH